MKTEIISYSLGTQFATYVANGDFDHLSDEEKSQFDDLEEAARINAQEGYRFSHWAIDIDNRNEFTRCEATDLMGDCCQFDAVYFETDHQTT